MNPVTILTGIAYCLVLVVEARQWNSCLDRRAEIIGWAVLALHAIFFTLAYVYFSIVSDVPSLAFNTWSSSLRLHGAITILTIAIARYMRREKRRGC